MDHDDQLYGLLMADDSYLPLDTLVDMANERGWIIEFDNDDEVDNGF